MSLCFATAFYHTQGDAPNLGRSTYTKKTAAYYRCIVVFAASIRRIYRSEPIIVFTNQKIDEPYQRLLDSLGVEVRILPKSDIVYATQQRLVNQFPGCLFTLDVLTYLAEGDGLAGVSSLYLLDSDCFFLRKIDDLRDRIESDGLLTGMPYPYDINRVVNGQTRATLTLLLERIQRSQHCVVSDSIITYFGGEFYGFAMSQLPMVAHEMRHVWRFLEEQTDMFGNRYTEEHIMSLIYGLRRDRVFIADRTIKRAWTLDTNHNLDGSEMEYAILHLPAEKDGFFRAVFHRLKADIGALDKLTDAEVRRLVGSLFVYSPTRKMLAKAKQLTHNALSRIP